MRGVTRPDAGDAMAVYGTPVRLPSGCTITWHRHRDGLHLELEQHGRTARRDIPAKAMDHVDKAHPAVQRAIDAAATELGGAT